jgi:hypothetical protein
LDFRFGDFEIDAARQELRQAGAPVHIEPQVFDLLVYLVQHRDRIVSKDELARPRHLGGGAQLPNQCGAARSGRQRQRSDLNPHAA